MITFLSFMNFLPINSYACSCVEPNTAEAFERSSAVFSGEVVEIVDKNKNKSQQSSADSIAVIFEVKESWKGPNWTKITVNTERSSASCGYEFSLNTEYLVYAREADGALNVSLCSKTTPLLAAGKDISELGNGEQPIEQLSNDSIDMKDENHIPLESSVNNNKIYITLLIFGLFLVVAYISRRIRK
ncbi:MAG: hypothetical protein RR595_03345 [Lysinibacillus sp.]